MSLLEQYPHLKPSRTFGRARSNVDWITKRPIFEQMWRDKVDVEEMSDFFGVTPATIYTKASQWKLGRRIKRGKGGKRRRTLPKRDSTRQRRFTGVESGNGAHVVLQEHDPRLTLGLTIFPTMVKPASAVARLLKSGEHSRKIGRQFDRGHWKGMPISTLTLHERFTCPRTCKEWATCYGNNMPFATRILDDGTLTRRLWGELAALAAEHPAGFAVRLHVLGDFFSVEYVEFWRQALADFPALHIFGFTARRPDDPIGAALIFLTRDEPLRFRMRYSAAGYETDSAEVVDRREEATGAVCPAERDPEKSCATCCFCPSSNKTIFFIRH